MLHAGFLIRKASAAFTPLALFSAGEGGAWYEGGTVTGNPISAVPDKSPNGNNLAQATSGNRPLAGDDGSGHKWIDFDGVDDNVAGSTLGGLITTTDFDIVVCGRVTAAGGAGKVIFQDNLGYLLMQVATLSGVEKLGFEFWDTGYRQIYAPYTTNTDFVVHLRFTGGVLTLTVNANTPVTLSVGALGSVAGVMSLGRAGLLFSGRIYGFVSHKVLLTSGQLANLKTYLANLCITPPSV